MARVVPILNILQKALMWPNNRFLPNDPGLLAFVTPDKWDLGDAAACHLIAKHLSIDLAGRDVGRLIEDDRTLGEIVGWLLERAEREKATS